MWLSNGVEDGGTWASGHYQTSINPSYYSQVAWPMLRVWEKTNDNQIKINAEMVLKRITCLESKNGQIKGWGFDTKKPAFTHTIAYTLRGLIESAIILDNWSDYGKCTEKALNKLYRQSELKSGRLPGSYTNGWKGDNSYTCLTGNAQVAICLIRYEKLFPDLRLINASCKLIDYICNTQNSISKKLRGSVAGSSPIWGKYMRFRYPNWAAKYHSDALMLLIKRLRSEKEKI